MHAPHVNMCHHVLSRRGKQDLAASPSASLRSPGPCRKRLDLLSAEAGTQALLFYAYHKLKKYSVASTDAKRMIVARKLH